MIQSTIPPCFKLRKCFPYCTVALIYSLDVVDKLLYDLWSVETRTSAKGRLMKNWKIKRPVCAVLCLLLVALPGCGREERDEVRGSFSGTSSDLKSTAVAATLEAPLDKERNAIWCGSMVACWKTMADEIIKAEPQVANSPMTTRLNAARDSRKDIAPEDIYTAAGWYADGIIEKITAGLAAKFPSKAAPVFPTFLEEAFISYAYLEVTMKFTEPYFRNKQSLEFTDVAGKTSKLSSFGIRTSDDPNHKLEGQAEILHCNQDRETHKMKSFIVDLDSENKTQLVVAAVVPKATLAETLADVEAKIVAGQKEKSLVRYLEGIDTLLVPDMDWRIKHRFSELEGKALLNPAMKAKEMEFAFVQQDTRFRLDRRGAKLESEVMIGVTVACAPREIKKPVPRRFVFDRPFLLYMKERGAKQPYFVMWVADAELLSKWTDK